MTTLRKPRVDKAFFYYLRHVTATYINPNFVPSLSLSKKPANFFLAAAAIATMMFSETYRKESALLLLNPSEILFLFTSSLPLHPLRHDRNTTMKIANLCGK